MSREYMSPAPKRGPDWVCDCGTLNGCDRSMCIGCGKPRSKNAIAPFEYETGQLIRTVMIGGEPWFIAADVCAVLDITNVGNALARLDDDEKDSIRLPDGTPGNPNRGIVSEPGLYALIVRSDRPEAKRFRRWVTHEVLPAIRQTGGYGTSAIPDMSTPQGRLQILDMAMAAERRALAAEEKIAELEPEAARARQTMDAHGLSLVRNVAKRFGIREKTLREFMYGEKLLIRGGSSHNEPYARHVQAGHFEVKTTLVEINPDRPAESKSTTYVTPKGEALIWRRLHAAGLVSSPTMPGEQLALTGGE